MSSSPLTSARIEMSNSTAFPKVAFCSEIRRGIDKGFDQPDKEGRLQLTMRPPRVSPTLRASCSVANPSSEARGMMASMAKTKTSV
jgi:hypothetical protein